MDGVDFVQDMMLSRQKKATQIYYTTPQAKAYHLAGCLSIRGAHELIEMTAEEAEALGKKKCGNCLGKE